MNEPTCSVDGCERPPIARGMCATDWDRWRKTLKKAGLPLPPLDPKPPVICKAKDCNEQAGQRSGLCRHHYLVNRKHGNPDAPDGRKTRAPAPEVRFWAKVDKNGAVPAHRPELGRCWVWTAATVNGYGSFNPGVATGRSNVGAHRFAYELLVGPIPDGLELDHLCHPGDGSCPFATCPHHACVNPAHLEPVTLQVNMDRGHTFAAVNRVKTHCPQGHEYTEENTRVRIGRSGNVNRSCKKCAYREPSGKVNPLIVANAAKTHCPQGHEYTPENTFVDYGVGGRNGGRRCKTCRSEQQKRRYQQKRNDSVS